MIAILCCTLWQELLHFLKTAKLMKCQLILADNILQNSMDDGRIPFLDQVAIKIIRMLEG